MRCVLQRVLSASVTVDGATRASIERGFLVLVGLETTDTDAQVRWMAEKIPNLRVFEDDQGKMNRSVLDVGGSILLVPNFTLAGDCERGRRPSFDRAMRPELAEGMFQSFAAQIAGALDGVVGTHEAKATVQTGVFRADMKVSLVNDGPVTLVIDAPAPQHPASK
jgi:D-tyrosyl-tRNA(Tyr) deacylase